MDQSPPSLQAAPPAADKLGRAASYHAALHSVQKPPGKPWKKPDHPPAPRVYRVDPRGFRQLVQQLTGAAPRSMPPQPHQSLRDNMVPPPPPLNVAPSLAFLQPPVMGGDADAVSGDQSPTGFMGLLSPSLYSSLRSFPLLSPAGPIGSMEHM